MFKLERLAINICGISFWTIIANQKTFQTVSNGLRNSVLLLVSNDSNVIEYGKLN